MDISAVTILDQPVAASSRWRERTWFVAWRLLVIVVFISITWWSYVQGQRLRRWVWDYTQPIHFFHDVNNGYYWGSQAWESRETDPRRRDPNDPNAPGILNVYDVVAARSGDWNGDDQKDYGLDYAPLRLTLISKWVKWGRDTYPDRRQWRIARRAAQNGSNPSYWETPFAFYKPMLDFNTAMEIAGVIGLFLLTRHWVVRWHRGKVKPEIQPGRRWPWYRLIDWFNSPHPFRGWIAGTIAGLLFWFNPAILLSAHGWPTWDMWVIPFFVWALYLACIDWWFVSGLVIATAATFKGQQLLVAPFFILWPLFAGRPLVAIRWAVGVVFGVAAIASPWLLTYLPEGVKPVIGSRLLDTAAVQWLITLAAVTILLPPALLWLRPWRTRRWHPAARWAAWAVPIPMAAYLAYQPFSHDSLHWAIGVGFVLAIAAGVALLPLKWSPILVAGVLGVGLLLCGTLYKGSMNWMNIGWGYGTRHYHVMQQGSSDNLAGILQRRFGWGPDDPVRLFDGAIDMPMRTFLICVYVVAFTPCVIGAAMQYRRNDPRFLVAATAAWVVFFAFLPQMHERYLIYAAGVACSLTAVGTGFTLLGVFMTIWTTAMTFHPMLGQAASGGRLTQALTNSAGESYAPLLKQFLKLTHPDMGWAIILLALIFMYVSVAPRKRPLA